MCFHTTKRKTVVESAVINFSPCSVAHTNPQVPEVSILTTLAQLFLPNSLTYWCRIPMSDSNPKAVAPQLCVGRDQDRATTLEELC